jgi:hypothetical protein
MDSTPTRKFENGLGRERCDTGLKIDFRDFSVKAFHTANFESGFAAGIDCRAVTEGVESALISPIFAVYREGHPMAAMTTLPRETFPFTRKIRELAETLLPPLWPLLRLAMVWKGGNPAALVSAMCSR